MSTSTMTAQDLLIELFTEELPPKALGRLSESFGESIRAALETKRLLTPASKIRLFATPRRLAVRITSVLPRSEDREVVLKGPSVKVGLGADGAPTQALIKWAEKQGVALASLTRVIDGKQEVFNARSTVAGEALTDLISAAIGQALARLPVPKLMQYQLADGVTTVEFVRPAHSLIVLFGDQVLPASVLGLASGRITQGHRFQGAAAISIDNAGSYENQLASEGRVLAGFAERRTNIREQLDHHANALAASLGPASEVEPLLDEVTALVEWPAVYVGQFEREFLAVPQECLILTMRTNQKYFPLFDGKGKLLPKFLMVSNMQISDPSLIIDGNERVVRPRLADARFFFEQDQRQPLAARLPQLASVVYHAKLGTQADRQARVRAVAQALCLMLSLPAELAQQVDRAAQLAKTDLLTGMVGEFPELQGIMGRYYALHDGEHQAVADAIADQYSPRFAGDGLPRAEVGTVLAMADKLETLAGLFAIGQQPTGDRDPFALRRHALGVLRMLIEKALPLDLMRIVDAALSVFSAAQRSHTTASADLLGFFQDRLAGYLRDRGYSAAEVAAVLEVSPTQLADVPERLAAVRSFASLPAAQALAAANKRTGNILRKTPVDDTARVDGTLLLEPAERALAATVERLEPDVAASLSRRDYVGALGLLAQAREPVDNFFNDVMVMAEDARLRDNRLALLQRLHRLMNRVADISKLSA